MVKEINLDLPELLGKSETVTSPGASVQLPHNATSASVALVIEGKCVQTGTPSPDAPAPITTITGDLTITVADGDLSDTSTIPLGAVELCSLPDGTKDSYDAVTGVLTKRCGKVVLNGTTQTARWFNPGSGSYCFGECYVSGLGTATETYALTDKFPYRIDTNWAASGGEGAKYSGGCVYISLAKSRLATVDIAGYCAWLAANPVTVYYKLAEPYTVHLDYSLPPVEGGEEMSVDTSLPTEIVWRYERMLWLPFEEIALVLDE